MSEPLPSIAAATGALERQPGLFPLYWDATAGTLWLEVAALGEEFLYVDAATVGLGVPELRVDRNQLGHTRLVAFNRSGPRLLLVQHNAHHPSMEAFADDDSRHAAADAVADAFPQSVLWSFMIAAEEEGRLLVDATAFFTRDATGLVRTLRNSDQGSYEVDPDRCAIHPPGMGVFPDNTEVEALVSAVSSGGAKPGASIATVAADAAVITVRQHHSLVRLPDNGFRSRPHDPRINFVPVSVVDHYAAIGEPIQRSVIARHWLVGRGGGRAPLVPITYYVDRGIPEPVRDAVIEGASWWSAAFEAAGFADAFRVELLPVGAHPMDIRYNVIQWVHRARRSWSYGTGVRDPRSGEIIKGNVILGSQRVRHVYAIVEALTGACDTGTAAADDMPLQVALARIRQLACHEVGHALGLTHNFSSHLDGRASVMDYPAPLIELSDDGTLHTARAYETGLGAWDMLAIEYGYREFASPEEETAGLARTLSAAAARGLHYGPDADAAPGAASAEAHRWVNGADPIVELSRLMELRSTALQRFAVDRVPAGRPLGALQEPLTLVYFLHRYQLAAVARLIGGRHFRHEVRGRAADRGGSASANAPVTPVPLNRQRRALDALLAALTPDALMLPEHLRRLVPPRPPAWPTHDDLPANRTGGTFDADAAAEGLADLVMAELLHPARASRIVDADNADLGLAELCQELAAATVGAADSRGGVAARVLQLAGHAFVYRLMRLRVSDEVPAAVQAVAHEQLRALRDRPTDGAFGQFIAHSVDALLRDPGTVPLPEPVSAPTGPPI